jgi:hypothetical protein
MEETGFPDYVHYIDQIVNYDTQALERIKLAETLDTPLMTGISSRSLVHPKVFPHISETAFEVHVDKIKDLQKAETLIFSFVPVADGAPPPGTQKHKPVRFESSPYKVPATKATSFDIGWSCTFPLDSRPKSKVELDSYAFDLVLSTKGFFSAKTLYPSLSFLPHSHSPLCVPDFHVSLSPPLVDPCASR